MKRNLLLFGWIIGILFPLGWLSHYSDLYRQVFNTVFGPPWVHILMHGLLYFVLAYLLAGLVLNAHLPTISPYRLMVVLGLILVIALGQESFQLLYQGRLPGTDEWLDIGVDLVGGGLGLFIFCAVCRLGDSHSE